MTQEEKQLLLKDLCARLPYGVMLRHKNVDGNYKLVSVFNDGSGRIGVSQNDIPLTPTSIDVCQPYLRPLSSMTEEEKDEYDSMFSNARRIYCNCAYYDTVQEDDIPDFVDWLLEHHFDYRGLIEKGLALEAPNDMYKTE